ncbi:alpha/beta hydrolase [Amycolatopsis sp. PS_44_ISF1]|uniref:alpha/beta hydrolase n=1 Tax=Amycolatopsis sp. PS_44_ISF1 TaxID=2974917 RepID=UPI0028DD5510|nr:alpha/beta hydrolase [Amycolatopsis sp. PS_44_ISF1]MDT8914024.1 alpha/beta hydrolase [Amycolatopsis sp. PS_44_ISF1]
MKRALAAVALLLAASASACSVPSPTPPAVTPPAGPTAPAPPAEPPPALGTNGAAVPVLGWAPCHGGFRCAAAAVPLSYRDPHGPQLTLSVVELPATDPAHRIGSLFFNYGGPGADGVGELTRFGSRYPPELRARFDLVSFDPRGIGGSAPIHCPGAEDVRPGGSPLRPEQSAAFWSAGAAPGRACAAGTGAELAHLSTANVARDLDLLRQAVGDRELNYYGYSYGTYLGGTYANLFPGRLRAMTLDGTLDLVANSTGRPGQEHEPVDVRADVAAAQQEELEQFFAACTAAGAPKCAFAGGDPKAKFAAVFARLSHGPVGGVTTASLMETIQSALYQTGRWKRLGQTLAALVPSAPVARTPVLDPYVPVHSTGFLAVQCLDSELPRRTADYPPLAAAQEQRQPYFGLAPVFSLAQCVDWPVRDEDRYTGPWNRPRAHPVLVLNNRYDPATPLSDAHATAAELGDGKVLVVDGSGHTSLNGPSACASAAVVRYFTDLLPPADGATCAPDTVPFP